MVISKLDGMLTSRGLQEVVTESSGLFSLFQKFKWNSSARITSTLATIIQAD